MRKGNDLMLFGDMRWQATTRFCICLGMPIVCLVLILMILITVYYPSAKGESTSHI
jgi:hypothetical protein